jgi:hypothetical protein
LEKIKQRAPPKGLLLKHTRLFTAAKSNNITIILSAGFHYYENDVNVKDSHDNTPLYYAAKNGNKEICEFLLAHNAKVNIRCQNGNTPLHMAFFSGQPLVRLNIM